ncbi:hypothetical protein FQN54_008442 [Arachnomyces sp. PD_36]|nr:hypothetical protein FQN54_008442 [Arachnomyces sp. PD_36]
MSEKISPGSDISKKDYEDLIHDFLQKVSYKNPKCILNDGDLRGYVEKRLKEHGMSDDTIGKMQHAINTGVDIASCSYSHLSVEARASIALFSSYFIATDDLSEDHGQEFQGYISQLVLGRPPELELLRGYTKAMSEKPERFGPFAGAMIIKSTLDYLSVTKVESEGVNLSRLSLDTLDFLDHFRGKTGIAEAYSYFLFPEDRYPEEKNLSRYIAAIPTLIQYFDYGNDVLSFYKEELSPTESQNFVHIQARLHGITPLESLKRTQEFTIGIIQKLRRIFADDPDLLEDIEGFIHKYIYYHLACKRYKLAELGIPAAVEATEEYHGKL